jgi:hypothetical protein
MESGGPLRESLIIGKLGHLGRLDGRLPLNSKRVCMLIAAGGAKKLDGNCRPRRPLSSAYSWRLEPSSFISIGVRVRPVRCNRMMRLPLFQYCTSIPAVRRPGANRSR